MISPQRPLHLLFFHEPPADHLVNRRFDERRADSFSLVPAITQIIHAPMWGATHCCKFLLPLIRLRRGIGEQSQSVCWPMRLENPSRYR